MKLQVCNCSVVDKYRVARIPGEIVDSDDFSKEDGKYFSDLGYLVPLSKATPQPETEVDKVRDESDA